MTIDALNVHCSSVEGTFDDCQDFVKALFADPLVNATQKLAAIDSIKWGKILAQMTYYFSSYFALIHLGIFNHLADHICFVVPTT